VSRSYGFFIGACGNPYTTERAYRHALVSSSVPAVCTSARSPLTNPPTASFLVLNARRLRVPRLRARTWHCDRHLLHRSGRRRAASAGTEPVAFFSWSLPRGLRSGPPPPLSAVRGFPSIPSIPAAGTASTGTHSSSRTPFLCGRCVPPLSVASARGAVQHRRRGHVLARHPRPLPPRVPHERAARAQPTHDPTHDEI
jgi:hypothetical protein